MLIEPVIKARLEDFQDTRLEQRVGIGVGRFDGVFHFGFLLPSAGVGARRDAGFVEEIDDFPGQAPEFVVEVVGQKIDALVCALDAPAHLGEMRRLLVAELVELRTDLAQQFFEFLLERGLALEVVDDLEKDEKDRTEGRRIDEPGGKVRSHPAAGTSCAKTSGSRIRFCPK